MNKKIIFSLIACVILAVTIFPAIVSAQVGAPDSCTIRKSGAANMTRDVDGIACPLVGVKCEFDEPNLDCGVCCLLNSVYTVTDWIFIFLMALSALMIVIGAFNFVTSGGDEKKTQAGRNYITYAAIGIAIALFARAIPAIVKMMIGMS